MHKRNYVQMNKIIWESLRIIRLWTVFHLIFLHEKIIFGVSLQTSNFEVYPNFHFFDIFWTATAAASLPGAPMTPPPGWAPLPQRRSPSTGVSGIGLPPSGTIGRVKKSWSRDIDPWKMFPPVRPKVDSRTGGGKTSLPTMLSLKPK